MSRENENRETYHTTEITKIKKDIDRMQKVSDELLAEVNHLISLRNGCGLDGLSQTEIDKLTSDTRKKIKGLSRQLRPRDHPVNKPNLVPRASDVAPEGGRNMKPSDDVDDEMKKNHHQGESSKSGDVDDDDDTLSLSGWIINNN
ncbi:unnamed protein product [Eruca vesicaria subsp. sativa]|uniref:K-box domain-containing protein n=1 Tax=Eruca vesicaria subsp. sativa TaxID=29727 RepID=A0ABC8LF30_ERUVS|nr:unnamed protein product [Eruca vesicaria subsp. sativa]